MIKLLNGETKNHVNHVNPVKTLKKSCITLDITCKY